ncbi:MAG: putative quinol monooxygenase [Patescibacteria group bacterium]
MPGDGVVVLIEYRALAGLETVAQRELAGLVAIVVGNEPDCSGIEILRDVDDATRLILYERWSSRDAYTGPHMRTPHILEFIARAGDFMAGPPTITFLDPVD